MFEALSIQAQVASVTAVQKAVYRCSADLGLLVLVDKGCIKILSTRELTIEETDILLRHVNDYALREKIANETEEYRNAILAAALLRLYDHKSEA